MKKLPLNNPPSAGDHVFDPQEVNVISSSANQETFTPEDLRKFPGCEHFTDEQATEIVLAIKQLTEIIFDLAIPDKIYNVDYQLDIELNQAA